MGRQTRFIPENENGVLVEVTCRVIGARAMLLPAPNPSRFNEVIVGVVGRALEVSPLEMCSLVWTANHWHGLLIVHDQQQLSRFMHHVGCNISKEIGGRIRKWRGAFWEARYDGIVVSHEPEAQWQRLKYHLSHGVKEGLVESPLDWPGVHAAKPLVNAEPIEGYWFNRRKEWSARNRGVDFGRYDFATRYKLGFAPLPAFRSLTLKEYQDKVTELIKTIEEEGRNRRDGDGVAGVERVLSQNPYEPPTRKTKRSSKPKFHFASKQARIELQTELSAFLTQYSEASSALRNGRPEAISWFPKDCYPPALAFTGPPPPRSQTPPTRRIELLESGVVERGEVPVVEVAVRVWTTSAQVRARGQPP